MIEPVQFYAAFASRDPPPESGMIENAPADPDRGRTAALLAERTPEMLSRDELRDVVGDQLGVLTPAALLHFLPRFMVAALDEYASLTVFASRLIDQLVPVTRADVEATYDLLAQMRRRTGAGLPDDTLATLRAQAREALDEANAGEPARLARRFASVTPGEAGAILAFLRAFAERHGADFPGNELARACAYWELRAGGEAG